MSEYHILENTQIIFIGEMELNCVVFNYRNIALICDGEDLKIIKKDIKRKVPIPIILNGTYYVCYMKIDKKKSKGIILYVTLEYLTEKEAEEYLEKVGG